MSKLWKIVIAGATGTIGKQLIECLEERSFPAGQIRLLAGSKNVGQVIEFAGKSIVVEELTAASFEGADIAFFSAGSEQAREFCPAAARAGAVCIDTSNAWRMDPDVPLVVPEVNPAAIGRYARKGIVASPGCAATLLAVALKPLHDYGAITRVVVSTYEAVSSSGEKAIAELDRQVKSLLQGKPAAVSVFPHQIAFNCLPQIGSFGDDGYTSQEKRMCDEIRKMMKTEIAISVTAVRVPIFYGHCQSINIVTQRKIAPATAHRLLQDAPGCLLVDDPVGAVYPMPVDAAGQDFVLVGRIREDFSVENGLNLWVAADNLRKGAATNAVQIAEVLIERYLAGGR